MQIIAPRPTPPIADRSRLTTYLSTLTYEAIPPAAIEAAKTSILDTLAVAWAARSASGMAAVHQTVVDDGGAPHSLLWGTSQRVPAKAAAFYNGSLAAALDFDSLHPHTSHADAVVVPAAIAVAERVHATGRQLLAASIAGTELVYRLGRATSSTTGWFRTSVYGTFGAAAAAARLLSLDADQTASALGLALGQTSGTQQGHIERKLSKRLQSAFAARAGVDAAQLAQLGISGPVQAFDGQFGLFALYDAGDPSQAFDDLGTRFLTPLTTFKKFPSCGCSHAAIEAALQLVRQHGLAAGDIEHAEVLITPYMDRLVGAPFSTDGDAEVTGQFCAQYAVAAVLARGRFTLADIEPAAVLDEALRPLLARVQVKVDPQATGTMAPATVSVVLRDGRRLSHTVGTLPGGAEQPLTRDDLRAKAHGALRQGPGGLGEAGALALIERIEHLEQLDDVARLFDGIA